MSREGEPVARAEALLPGFATATIFPKGASSVQRDSAPSQEPDFRVPPSLAPHSPEPGSRPPKKEPFPRKIRAPFLAPCRIPFRSTLCLHVRSRDIPLRYNTSFPVPSKAPFPLVPFRHLAALYSLLSICFRFVRTLFHREDAASAISSPVSREILNTGTAASSFSPTRSRACPCWSCSVTSRHDGSLLSNRRSSAISDHRLLWHPNRRHPLPENREAARYPTLSPDAETHP